MPVYKMHPQRTSSAKGTPPPFRPQTAACTIKPYRPNKKPRATSAHTVTFKMQLQFNLSRPVLSPQFQSLTSNHGDGRSTRSLGGMKRASGMSSVSSRSPLDLPMSISLNQSRRNMADRRTVRQCEFQNVKDVEKASGVLREYGKKLFDDAVEKETQADPLNNTYMSSDFSEAKVANLRNISIAKTSSKSDFDTESRESSFPTLGGCNGSTTIGASYERHLPSYARTSRCNVSSRTNGPTVAGSPLYNKRVKLMKDIRSRPQPEPRMYNHERFRSAPQEIRQRIESLNATYRVVSSISAVSPRTDCRHKFGSTPPIYNNLLLIPKDENSERYPPRSQNDVLLLISDQDPAHGSPSPVVASDCLDDDVFEIKNEEREDFIRIDNVLTEGDHELTNLNVPTLGMIPSKYEENTTGDKDGDAAEDLGVTKKGSVTGDQGKTRPTSALKTRRPKIQSPLKDQAGGDPPDPPSTSSSLSSLPSRPSSARYWLKKTWVDTATVTSSRAEADQEDDNQFDPQTDKSKVLPPKPAAPSPTNELNPTPATIANTAHRNPKIDILNLKDLQTRRRNLPDFICPSSESKSREAAVRNWLETISIHWAVKTAPLL